MSHSDLVEDSTNRSENTAPHSELEHEAHDHVAQGHRAADEDSLEVPGLEEAQATGEQVCS